MCCNGEKDYLIGRKLCLEYNSVISTLRSFEKNFVKPTFSLIIDFTKYLRERQLLLAFPRHKVRKLWEFSLMHYW